MINMPRADMLTVIRKLGLSTGLKLCLDAGDGASYASGQSWLDLSGNGYDFFRGADGSATATDPTFNGTAGRRSSGEYWSFDGGDYFTYDSANETWMQNIHKDNAKFTLATWLYVDSTTGAERSLAGLNGWNGGTGGTGIGWQLNNSTNGIHVFCMNAGAFPLNSVSSLVPTANAWSFCAISLDEAVGSNGGRHFLNGTSSLFTSTYTSPSAGNASNTMTIGANGGNNIIDSGSRMASFMAWEGVALDGPQLQAIFQATRGKFGV